MRRNEIESLAHLQREIDAGHDLAGYTVQGVNLTGVRGLAQARLRGSVWLGCQLRKEHLDLLHRGGAMVFPEMDHLPYRPYRTRLYTVEELMQGYADGGYTHTLDFAIYAHAHRQRRQPGGITVAEALGQRIHDHAIDDALGEFLADHGQRGVVGVMGGHGTARSDPYFRVVARITWQLTRAGYLVVSGGGPGVMEAANLGAWLAGHDDVGVVDRAIAMLVAADTMSGGHAEGTVAYLDAIQAYIRRARQVVQRLEHEPGASLAVPTWFYGHEPSNLFATAIAKYFDNSIREEGLLAVATAGVIYAPGSAGTMQELFQDLTQNHYATYGVRSPMVLLGSHRYQAELELLQRFVRDHGMEATYGDLITLLDDDTAVVRFIRQHPPRPVRHQPALYEIATG